MADQDRGNGLTTKNTKGHRKCSLPLLLTEVFGSAFEQTVDIAGGTECIAGKDDVNVVGVFEFGELVKNEGRADPATGEDGIVEMFDVLAIGRNNVDEPREPGGTSTVKFPQLTGKILL